MKPIPTEPMAQHSRFIDAFCQDYLAGDYDAPRAKAVCEISRQLEFSRSAGPAEQAPAGD